MHAQFGEDVFQVHLDRLGADVERLCDFFIREPLSEERQDLVLAVGQRHAVREIGSEGLRSGG